MIIRKNLGRTSLLWAFHCSQLHPTSQSFKRMPLSPTLYPWVPTIKDMAYCLPGVSLKEKQDAEKKIHVGIWGGTMEEEVSAVPAVDKSSEWGYELQKKSRACYVLKYGAQIPYGKQSLSLLASADRPSLIFLHVSPYSLCAMEPALCPSRSRHGVLFVSKKRCSLEKETDAEFLRFYMAKCMAKEPEATLLGDIKGSQARVLQHILKNQRLGGTVNRRPKPHQASYRRRKRNARGQTTSQSGDFRPD